MRANLIAFVLLACGCAPAHYLYGFDLTDPGAVNYKDFRRPDALEDANVKLEVRLDPTEFKAVAIDLTNKTGDPLQIPGAFAIVGPDGQQTPLTANVPLAPLEGGAHVSFQLAPFELPAIGEAAKGYDGANFELVVPLVVQGQPHEYRCHLHATLQKI